MTCQNVTNLYILLLFMTIFGRTLHQKPVAESRQDRSTGLISVSPVWPTWHDQIHSQDCVCWPPSIPTCQWQELGTAIGKHSPIWLLHHGITVVVILVFVIPFFLLRIRSSSFLPGKQDSQPNLQCIQRLHSEFHMGSHIVGSKEVDRRQLESSLEPWFCWRLSRFCWRKCCLVVLNKHRSGLSVLEITIFQNRVREGKYYDDL